MLLTGPVLQYRKTIGELGRVQIYVDASSSMTLRDRHMPLGRKLKIAESLGWIAPGSIDTSLIESADELAAHVANWKSTSTVMEHRVPRSSIRRRKISLTP